MARKGSVPYLLGTDFYRLAFVAFGDPQAPAIICVHGLTRNGRDFDILAEALAAQFHVICPDLPGRGESDWLPSGALYQPATYVTALAHLLAHINKPVAWIGTSLGGICGMMIAAAHHTPVTRLVLNDIGPHIPAAALIRIRDYIAERPEVFPTISALEAHLRLIHAPFGALSDSQWAHLAANSARPLPHGGYTMHYDPKIADLIRATAPRDADLEPVWRQISVPVLAIQGAGSDLLTASTLDQMKKDGAATFIVPEAGHAPALMDAATIAAIFQFLEPVR
jgi:pimeloyl-ACP methyl ester carboxylesterase